MATIKEIAEKCGVSVATVSKALNGYPDIGPETARLVSETAKLLGYHPDSIARTLKTKRSNNLGVLFIDKMRSGLGHEYFSGLLESVKVRAEERGYDITFISRNVGGKPMSYLEHCRYRRCDGVVIASVDFNDPQVIELVNGDIPVVTIDHVFNNRTSILSDNVQGIQDLTRYIYDCGHRRIAYIHGEDTDVTQKRLAGFHIVCKQLGIDIPKPYLRASRYHDGGACMDITRELLSLDTPPTCIIYPDDFSSVGGLSEIERAGLSIPDDVSIAGYDGIYLLQSLRPKLTTLRQDTHALGAMAADKLINAITEPSTAFPEQITIPGQLLKGSTVKVLHK